MTQLPSYRVAAIVAHADDEVLGCGGALYKHAAAGAEVEVVILADGETSRDTASGEALVGKREAAAHAAAEILGVRRVHLHRFADNRMDGSTLLDVVKVVEAHLASRPADIVYTHHVGDVNVDHQIVHRAVVTACRPQGVASPETILFFETASSTEWQMPGAAPTFMPTWFVDISDALDAKLRALRAYDAEMRPWPHPRSYAGVEHLARWRGATVGCDAAEAFILGRRIQR